MVSLEQVKLLETKVAKAIDFVKSLSEENAALRGKLDGYRRRIDELEVLVKAFKEDQGRIEAGIMSALERLNQFEDAVERGFSGAQDTAEAQPAADARVPAEEAEEPADEPAQSAAVDLPEAEGDEAILAELEAEEAAAREAAARAVAASVVETAAVAAAEMVAEPQNEEEARSDQGAELDIF